MSVQKKALPEHFEVPIESILAFAHKDLPTDFEGLFFLKYDKRDDAFGISEWKKTFDQDARYFFSFPPYAGKPPKEAGDINAEQVDYLLVYQHGGVQEIIGTYGAFRSKYYYQGVDEQGVAVQGHHNGWSLYVITNPNNKKMAEYGFLNAAGVSILSVFYEAGMRQVVVESHITNWRSNSFVRWMGFKNPIHITQISQNHDASQGEVIPTFHKFYVSDLSVIIRHMEKSAEVRKCQYFRKNGHYRSFVYADTAKPLDLSGQPIVDQIHDKIFNKFKQIADNFVKQHKNSGRN